MCPCTKTGFLTAESCAAQYTAHCTLVFSQTLMYIHIYTSLVKICTLHITVHTSHQLLANTRTLMKPKTTALKQAEGLVFPPGKFLWVTHSDETLLSRGAIEEGGPGSRNGPAAFLPPPTAVNSILLALQLWMPGAGIFCLPAASFLHLHVCFDGTATPSGATVLVTRQTKRECYATLNAKHFLQHSGR